MKQKICAKNLFEKIANDNYYATIVNSNEHGFFIDVKIEDEILIGFMPKILTAINILTQDEIEILKSTVFLVMPETLEKKGEYFVFSRRKYLQSLIPDEIKKIKKTIQYTGKITGVTNFGVFVEFGVDVVCLTGMIHKSNLIQNISEISPGMNIDFYIKEIYNKKENYKLILTQIFKKTIWDEIKCGDIINGIILNVLKNGDIKVKLEDDVFGSITKCDLDRYNKEIKIGDVAKLLVISFDKFRKRIYLDFFNESCHEQENICNNLYQGDILNGKIIKKFDTGNVLILLSNGFYGHMVKRNIEKINRDIILGETLTVVITYKNKERNKISLLLYNDTIVSALINQKT